MKFKADIATCEDGRDKILSVCQSNPDGDVLHDIIGVGVQSVHRVRYPVCVKSNGYVVDNKGFSVISDSFCYFAQNALEMAPNWDLCIFPASHAC
jgi:hypothetical protein